MPRFKLIRRRPHHHHHHGIGVGGFFSGLVGGVVGAGVVTAINNKDDGSSDPEFEKLMKHISNAPVGATVKLKLDEFRMLDEKGMITYKDKVPHCMDRIIET